ncbi:MAG: GNAT family N-acetyltransferase [Proteobacteria bacterium]|nr:GNAT family N-acetyltransferase [Pseudomonadota bacterium]MBU1418908.1 GNAT family N-acetyltransferase [Pseudomonadota bacterium]MBU1455668.1 GNAT family N-acetyltransferase [Pseudomonadota bacterium]
MTHIAPADLGDIPQLTALEEQSFSCDRISRRQFRYLMTKANSIVVKAEHNGMLTGYMVLLRRKTSRKLRIYSIGVTPSARNQGIARTMITYAEEMATKNNCCKLTLEVCEHNSAAVQLYKNTGFHQYGLKKNYYEDGCTALLLQKNLVPKDTIL